MQNGQQHNRFSRTWFAGIAGVILVLGGVAWWAKSSWNNSNQIPISNNPDTVQENPRQQEPIAQRQEQVAICWLNPTENTIELVQKTLSFPASVTNNQILESAFSQLLAGPSKSADYTTTIPEGTKLLDLNATEEGVTVNLSQEFATGGGSASMTSRLAQVVYTATSLDSNGKVWINVEGKPLAILGGEGITVSQPMTRQEFQEHFTL
ncbi:MAG: GerMN domain-containing protein [Xenococcus sp. (in: cyanobacteria)]